MREWDELAAGYMLQAQLENRLIFSIEEARTFILEMTPDVLESKSMGHQFLDNVAESLARFSKSFMLREIWMQTHNDYKGHLDGERTVMMLRNGETTIVMLKDLTDDEIRSQLSLKMNYPKAKGIIWHHEGEQPMAIRKAISYILGTVQAAQEDIDQAQNLLKQCKFE